MEFPEKEGLEPCVTVSFLMARRKIDRQENLTFAQSLVFLAGSARVRLRFSSAFCLTTSVALWIIVTDIDRTWKPLIIGNTKE